MRGSVQTETFWHVLCWMMTPSRAGENIAACWGLFLYPQRDSGSKAPCKDLLCHSQFKVWEEISLVENPSCFYWFFFFFFWNVCVLNVLNLFICIEYSPGFCCCEHGLVVWSLLEVCPSLPGSQKQISPAAPQISGPGKPLGSACFSSKDEIHPIQIKVEGYSEYLPDLGETMDNRMQSIRGWMQNFQSRWVKLDSFVHF